MLQVALDDRLDEQRVLAGRGGGARAGRRALAERRGRAVALGDGGRDQAAVRAQGGGELRERRHAISANAAAAASSVRVTCSGVWASDGNHASNCDGGG